MKDDNVIVAKSKSFALRIIRLYQWLAKEKQEYVLSKQVLRSGTSIGANVKEGARAQSKADFVAKMSIALKEASETGVVAREQLCGTSAFREHLCRQSRVDKTLNVYYQNSKEE